MALICDHKYQYGPDVPRKAPPHEMCDGCRAISLPERDSDFFICCVCLKVNVYNREKRQAAVKEEQRRYARSRSAQW